MILVAYTEILSGMSIPSHFERYDSRWVKKSMDFGGSYLGF